MKISIVTATFNSGATVRDTIESVLRQTYADFEHLIIDGGSTDNTLEIVREYEPRYHGRLRWISERDRGIYDAMNKGIAMATGDVVGILNSDDFYTRPDILKSVAEAMQDPSVDAVYGDIHYVDADNLERTTRYYSSASFRRWKMRLGWMPAHPSFYCRRSVYERFGTFDISFKIGADFENLLRLIYVGRINTRYLPIDFVTMRSGGASTSGLRSHRQILADHLRAYRKNGVSSNVLLEGMRYAAKVGEVASFKFKSALGL